MYNFREKKLMKSISPPLLSCNDTQMATFITFLTGSCLAFFSIFSTN